MLIRQHSARDPFGPSYGQLILRSHGSASATCYRGGQYVLKECSTFTLLRRIWAPNLPRVLIPYVLIINLGNMRLLETISPCSVDFLHQPSLWAGGLLQMFSYMTKLPVLRAAVLLRTSSKSPLCHSSKSCAPPCHLTFLVERHPFLHSSDTTLISAEALSCWLDVNTCCIPFQLQMV